MTDNTEVNKPEELFDFGIKRLRGRPDSLAITLPRSFVKNHKLGPVGKCFVHMYMDQKKRLLIEVSDMTDFAEKPKRVRKPKPVQQVEEPQQQYEEPQAQTEGIEFPPYGTYPGE